MACACKLNRDLAFLQRKYGVAPRPENERDFKLEWREIFYATINFFGLLLFFPLFIVQILFSVFFLKKKNIDVSKVFRLKKH